MHIRNAEEMLEEMQIRNKCPIKQSNNLHKTHTAITKTKQATGRHARGLTCKSKLRTDHELKPRDRETERETESTGNRER